MAPGGHFDTTVLEPKPKEGWKIHATERLRYSNAQKWHHKIGKHVRSFAHIKWKLARGSSYFCVCVCMQKPRDPGSKIPVACSSLVLWHTKNVKLITIKENKLRVWITLLNYIANRSKVRSMFRVWFSFFSLFLFRHVFGCCARSRESVPVMQII